MDYKLIRTWDHDEVEQQIENLTDLFEGWRVHTFSVVYGEDGICYNVLMERNS